MPSDNDFDLYYKSYYQKRFQNIINTSLKLFRELITFKYYREYLFLKKATKYKKIVKFLDYGCGEGEMLIMGKKFGWECTGTEYSSELTEAYRKAGIHVVISKDFGHPELVNKDYDVILFKHLIEHIREIPNFLNSAKNFLSKNGIIMIKTPSNSSLRAKTGTSNWHLINPPEHLWSFNTHNFRKLLENFGFQVLSIRDSLVVNELICYARIKKEFSP
jgi:2-polyprenyl-3-methyl-5-hydroxy-6-metoxy-1,4-benzoquinol methylase